MPVHVDKPRLISRQDEPPAEPFSLLDNLQKFMTLPETIALLRLRPMMRHESASSINIAHTSRQDVKYL
jgi:hypothetical protein